MDNPSVTYEVCPHCGKEVELLAFLGVQTCPNCGKRSVTCSMCRACGEIDNYCENWCLEYQADVENEELEHNLSIHQAEEKVCKLAENEHIEDRVYELAQSLVDGYISKINVENTIVDCDGNACTGDGADGSMWYDEVRENAKKIIFEKLSEFFRK